MTIAICALIFKPIYLLHAPHDNVRVALIARRAVVVETVAELPVAADEVGGLDVDVGRRVVRARTRARDLRARYVDVAILRVVHKYRTVRDTRRDNDARSDDTVAVVEFDPVVVLHADLRRILLAHPDTLSAAEHREHLLRIEIHTVRAPLVVRREVLQRDFLLRAVQRLVHRTEVEDRAIDRLRLAKLAHDLVIHVEMLPSRQRAERNEFLHVVRKGGIAAVLVAARKGRAVIVSRGCAMT